MRISNIYYIYRVLLFFVKRHREATKTTCATFLMGKPLKYLLLLALALSTLSCKRYVCPAYFTAFNIEKGAPEQFFNYFVADTTKSVVQLKPKANDHRLLSFKKGDEPMNDRMFKSGGQNQNGLMNKKVPLIDKVIVSRQANTMRYVRAKITFPELDSLASAELYAVDDSLFSPEHYKRDQEVYMRMYGFRILDSMNAAKERRKAEKDSLDALYGEEDNAAEMKALAKERKKMQKEMRKNGELGKDEELSDEEFQQRWRERVANDPALQKEEQKRKEKRAKRNEKRKKRAPKPVKPKKEKPELSSNKKKDKDKDKKKEDDPDKEKPIVPSND